MDIKNPRKTLFEDVEGLTGEIPISNFGDLIPYQDPISAETLSCLRRPLIVVVVSVHRRHIENRWDPPPGPTWSGHTEYSRSLHAGDKDHSQVNDRGARSSHKWDR